MIGVVIGTRPELIKLRPVAVELVQLGVPLKIIYTHQHEAILHDVEVLAMQLSNNKRSYTFKPIGASFDPGTLACVVQGDTDTAAHSAIAAAYQRIPVVHVEAGLRTQLERILPVPDRPPFPEEMNRQLISRVASLHLAPTYGNEQNLVRENIGGRCVITGNSGITALVLLHSQLTDDERYTHHDRSILVTCHRRENWPHIAQLVDELSEVHRRSGYWITFVKHPNTVLYRDVHWGLGFTILDPLDHASLIRELQAAHLVVTDSGGLIEEATWLRKRRLVLRAETERPEACAPLVASIAGCQADILDALEQDEPSEGSRYAFGDEKSAANCAREIAKFYKEL